MIAAHAFPSASPTALTAIAAAIRTLPGLLLLATFSLVMLVPAASPNAAGHSIKQRLVGTWIFVSSVNTRKDGGIYDRWGANPKGVLMFDPNGRYSQIIMRSESSLFGGKTIFSFGTYTVDEANSTVITEIEGGSLSKLEGTKQRRKIKLLTVDELRYINLDGMSGTVVDATWKRAPVHQPQSASLSQPR